MDHLSKLEESALAKFGSGDFNGAISDLSKVGSLIFFACGSLCKF
jgi:hypothetical protein